MQGGPPSASREDWLRARGFTSVDGSHAERRASLPSFPRNPTRAPFFGQYHGFRDAPCTRASLTAINSGIRDFGVFRPVPFMRRYEAEEHVLSAVHDAEGRVLAVWLACEAEAECSYFRELSFFTRWCAEARCLPMRYHATLAPGVPLRRYNSRDTAVTHENCCVPSLELIISCFEKLTMLIAVRCVEIVAGSGPLLWQRARPVPRRGAYNTT